MEDKIVTIENKAGEQFLRKKTGEFDFTKFTRHEIHQLVTRMRKAMRIARGIGLSANQIGLNLRIFVVQIPQTRNYADRTQTNAEKFQGESAHSKSYAIFNPQIVKYSKGETPLEEGCLSIPGVYGEVERPEKVTLVGFDKSGKRLKIKAWGLLAKVFQHEMDHLNGALFIDRTKHLYQVPISERLKEKLNHESKSKNHDS